MIRIPCPQFSVITRIFVAAALLAVVLFQHAEASTVSFGPGKSGRITALAFDPDYPGTIYAGGDNCGLYVSTDGGDHWVLNNEGLENTDRTKSYYVDDILVLGSDSTAPETRQGVYLATHGGVYFKGRGSTSFNLLTDYADFSYAVWIYRNGAAEQRGIDAPIPFSALAYDELNQILYAGTGHGRYEADEIKDWELYYPQSDPNLDEYSIWYLDFNTGQWASLPESVNDGIVTQIAVSYHDDISEVVWACREGLKGTGDPMKAGGSGYDMWAAGWEAGSVPLDFEWSEHHWGVAAGSGGVIYALSERDMDDPTRGPGIFWKDFSADADTVDWQFLGDVDQQIPPLNREGVGSFSWADIGSWDDLTADPNEQYGVSTLTVVPGATQSEDVVYVGLSAASVRVEGGYYRYVGTQDLWVQMLGTEVEDRPAQNDMRYFSCKWTDQAVTSPLDVGWNTNFVPLSFERLAVNPADPSEMLAVLTATPMVSIDGGETWNQKNSTAGSSGWASKGLNILNSNDAAYMSDGSLLVAGMDDGLFKGTYPDNTEFEWLNWYTGGDHPHVKDVEVIHGNTAAEDEILVVRSMIHDWYHDEWWRSADLDPDGVHAIALYDNNHVSGGEEWIFLSQAIGDHCRGLGYPKYEIRDLEVYDSETLYATCLARVDESSNPHLNLVFRGTKDVEGLFRNWIPMAQFPQTGDSFATGNIDKIIRIPGTSRLVVSSFSKFTEAGGCWCVDVDDPSFLQTWMDFDRSTDVLDQAANMVTCLAASANGEAVYVGTRGVYSYNAPVSDQGFGTVVRFEGPFTDPDPLVMPQATVLANADGEDTFGIPLPHFHFEDQSEGRHLYTHITDLVVHPDNPKRVYAGLGFYALHPKNGVWRYAEDPGGAEPWKHIYGIEGEDDLGIACGEKLGFAAKCLSINPMDHSILDIGSQPAEFFRTSIPLLATPTIADRTEFALIDGTADTDSTLFAVRIQSTSGYPISAAFADFRSVDGGAPWRVALNDSAWGGDQYAGDGIWSARTTVTATSISDSTVTVVARDESWNTSSSVVEVDIIEPIGLLVDQSSDMGGLANPMSSNGNAATPVIAVTISRGIDLATQSTEGVKYVLAALDTVAVQVFEPQLDLNGDLTYISRRYRGEDFDPVPPADATSITVIDFDNDGYEDIFFCRGPYASAKLYRYAPPPGAGKFVDYTSAVFGTENVTGQAAAWGDYNQDGWIDLLLVAQNTSWQPSPPPGGAAAPPEGGSIGGAPPVIYRNITGKMEHAQSGFDLGFNATAFSASWCDVNNDGMLDAVVTDYWGTEEGGTTRVLQNMGWDATTQDYSFSDVTSNWIATAPDGVISAEFADLDADGDADLITAAHVGGNSIMISTNDHIAGDDLSAPQIDFGVSDVVIADLTRDGLLDLVALPHVDVVDPAEESEPRLILNRSTGAGNEFITVAAFDATERGRISAGLAYDADLNGTLDLYTARNPSSGTDPSAMEHFYYDNQLTTSNAFLRVRLRGGGSCDIAALGARVDVFETGGYTNRIAPATWVGGGNGTGRHNPRTLTIGLDRQVSTVNVRVTWPDGGIDHFAGVPTNQTNAEVLANSHRASISSVQESKVLATDHYEDWTFEWICSRPLSGVFVVLHTDPYGTNNPDCACDDPNPVFTELVSGVTVECEQIGLHQYRHRLIVEEWCCAQPCDYEFRVGGVLGRRTIQSAWLTTAQSDMCVKELPGPPGF